LAFRRSIGGKVENNKGTDPLDQSRPLNVGLAGYVATPTVLRNYSRRTFLNRFLRHGAHNINGAVDLRVPQQSRKQLNDFSIL
jgi:hypothetical protein